MCVLRPLTEWIIYTIYPASEKMTEYRIGTELVKKYKCRKILDVGCGKGNFYKILRKKCPPKKYTCIDKHRLFKPKDPNAELIHADARNPPPITENYDCVIFMNSLFYMGVETIQNYKDFAPIVIIIDVDPTHLQNKLLNIIEGKIRLPPNKLAEKLETLGFKILELGVGPQYYLAATSL